MNISELLKPELIAVSYALYVIGNSLKKSAKIEDSNIPIYLGGIGSIFCIVYILATGEFFDFKSIVLSICSGVIQGICAAGMSVYIHQIIKQKILE